MEHSILTVYFVNTIANLLKKNQHRPILHIKLVWALNEKSYKGTWLKAILPQEQIGYLKVYGSEKLGE
jgi:hypothetical protein